MTSRDSEVQALVANMTLEEKAGQMTQPDWGAIMDANDLRALFLGSVLCGGSSDPETGNSLEDWTTVYQTSQKQALGTRLGRTYEGFSEDPEVVAMLGQPAVRGLQGERLGGPESVLACVKHFVGDGGTSFGSTAADGLLDQGDTRVEEGTLRAIHLAG